MAMTLDLVRGGDAVQVPVRLLAGGRRPASGGRSRAVGWPDMRVDVEDPTTKQTLLQGALAIGPGLLVIAGLWLLRGFLRSVLAGDPFGARNVQRLRTSGSCSPPVPRSSRSSTRRCGTPSSTSCRSYPSLELGSAGFSLPLGAILAGLGAFILAEVFAYGAATARGRRGDHLTCRSSSTSTACWRSGG